MQSKSFHARVAKPVIVLVMTLLILPSIGCYKRPSAEKLKYDPETVQALREEIRSLDWNE